jgi:hypothetical protein
LRPQHLAVRGPRRLIHGEAVRGERGEDAAAVFGAHRPLDESVCLKPGNMPGQRALRQVGLLVTAGVLVAKRRAGQAPAAIGAADPDELVLSEAS